MDVTLVYKWGYDADEAYIASDGSFKWKKGKLVASDDDAAAIASAREIAGATGGTLTGATIGDGDAGWAIARGAACVYCDESCAIVPDDLAVANMLKAVVQAAPAADLVIMADSADRAGVAPALAETLGLPCVLGVRDVAVDPEDGTSLLAHRSVEGGMETLRFTAPALVSVSALTSEKTVPSMKEMLAAKKAPRTKVEAAAGGVSAVTERSISKADLKMARIFEGSPDEAAQQLVAALRADGVL